MKFHFPIFVLLTFLLLSTSASPFRHRSSRRSKVRLMVRRGSRLDHLHKTALNDWRKAYFFHNRRRSNSALDDILTQMDTFVRPRFG